MPPRPSSRTGTASSSEHVSKACACVLPERAPLGWSGAELQSSDGAAVSRSPLYSELQEALNTALVTTLYVVVLEHYSEGAAELLGRWSSSSRAVTAGPSLPAAVGSGPRQPGES